MSRKLRFRALIGLVAMIAVVIGVLVYPPPKEAKSTTSYFTVFIRDTDDGNGITGLDLNIVHITFYLNDQPVGGGAAYQELGGVYSFATEIPSTQFDEWDVRLDPPPNGFDFPLDPNPSFQQSSSSNNFPWYIDEP